MTSAQYDKYYGGLKKSLQGHNPSRLLKSYKSKNGIKKLFYYKKNYHVIWPCE